MPPPARSLCLTGALLQEHRSGAVLCLASASLGHSYRLSAERPSGYEVLRAYADDEAATEIHGGPELAPSGTGVAVVRTVGPIAQRAEYGDCGGWTEGYDTLTERVVAAHESELAGAVVLVLDGPGGDAAGCEQGVRRMLAAATASGKPVLVYVDEQAASAHYWIAAVLGTGGIYLPPSGQVGSIGCMSWHTDYSAANAAAGIVYTYFSTPSGKVAGNVDEPLSDLASSRCQASVDACASRFFEMVAAARGVTVEAVAALDGAMLAGPAALQAGLVDGLATFEDVVTLASARASARSTLALSSPALVPALVPEDYPMPRIPASSALLALLPGLAADASDVAVEVALLARLAGAQKTAVQMSALLAAIGEDDAEQAIGAASAHRLDAAKVVGLAAELATVSAASEHAERVALLEDAIVAGKYTAGEVWDTTSDGTRQLASVFGPIGPDGIGYTLRSLRANVARKCGSTRSAAPVQAKDDVAEVLHSPLTPHEQMLCATKGWSPAAFAAHKAKTTGGQLAAANT